MEYSRSLPPDTNFAPGLLIPCGILLVLDASLCVARIASRLRPSPHLHQDDYMIMIAAILSFFEYIATGIAAAHGWGHLSPYISQKNQTIAFQCLFAAQMLWIVATALVRISVACSLLRLSGCAGDAERIWKWCLRILIGVQFLASIGWFVLLVFNCHPLRGLWEPVPTLTCWAHKYTVMYGWVANPIIIVMDFILATMPVQLIRMLQRPLREKILISCLMATGLIATGIAAYKMTLSQQANVGDLLSSTVKLSLWCKLEEQVGIIAACLPCLKAQMDRLLHRLGILKSRFGRLSTFVVSLKQVWGRSPSASPQNSDMHEVDDVTRSDSDAGLVSFATNTDWTKGPIASWKSTTASSEIREIGSKNENV